MRDLSNLLCAYENDMGTVCDGYDLKAKGAHYRCTQQATEILVVHQMDECDARSVRWTATPKGTGNRVLLLCVSCSSNVCKEIDVMLARMKKALSPPASWLECTSCGRHIQNLSDICKTESLLNA